MMNLEDSSTKKRPRTIIFGEFTPDQPDLESQGLTKLRNALPMASGHYGPARDLAPLSKNSLSELATVDRVCGSIGSFTNLDNGDITAFAGGFNTTPSQAKLFAYDDGGKLWRDVSRTTAPYQFSAARHARFAQHGPDMFATLGRAEPIQVVAVGTEGTFTDVVGAPRPTDIAVVREFLVGINFSRAGLLFPDSVIWSSIVSPRNWPTPGTFAARDVQSGQAQIPGGGRLQRIIPGVGGADAIIVAESRIWRMTYIGPPSIWQFDVAVYNQGTSIPGSVAATDELIIYYGRSGYQMFNGAQNQPIGVGKIDETWLEDDDIGVQTTGDQGFQSAITSTVDSTRKIYLVSYPSAAELSIEDLLTASGEPLLTAAGEQLVVNVTVGRNDALLAFNYVTGKWGYAAIELDAIEMVDTQTTTVDQPILVAIGPDNFLSTFTGDVLEAEFAAGEFVSNTAMRDTIEAFLPGTDAGNVFMSVFLRDLLSKDPIQTPERAIDNDGYCPVDRDGATGRYWRANMRISAGTPWTFVMGVHVRYSDWGQGGFRGQ